jgi:hypothetical protein
MFSYASRTPTPIYISKLYISSARYNAKMAFNWSHATYINAMHIDEVVGDVVESSA